uniref:Ribosomal protein S16 n=1 Tax=Cryptomonas sp. CCAC 1634B TaxID=2051848 RepID=A0A679CBT6_9CRYP|nr:ribosomal protein S16 [Cryptomonas sp. CCAC 1634B]
MLKLRFKKYGRKGQHCYRVVAVHNSIKRDGKTLEELGTYNSKTKETTLNINRIRIRLAQGAQPTTTVANLLKKLTCTVDL